ncbi:MAG: glycosyltransferase family 2 protein [Candidatus Thorarchaeota archaeon]
MLGGKRITLVIIAYNEQKLIVPTLKSVPPIVDTVIVVDDCSTDETCSFVIEASKTDRRIHLIRHKNNRGPGGAIISGYAWFYLNGDDIAVVIGGDNQMDQSEMWKFITPLIEGNVDYCKGNRFLVDAFEKMPIRRLFGNFTLSLMTLIFSGYFVFDTQDGYTSISRSAVGRINWSAFHEGYGYVSDFIIRMKAYGLTLRDVPRRSIYLKGERQSQINIGKYMRRFFFLWLRAFRWRIRNYHPPLSDGIKFAKKRSDLWEQLV